MNVGRLLFAITNLTLNVAMLNTRFQKPKVQRESIATEEIRGVLKGVRNFVSLGPSDICN